MIAHSDDIVTFTQYYLIFNILMEIVVGRSIKVRVDRKKSRRNRYLPTLRSFMQIEKPYGFQQMKILKCTVVTKSESSQWQSWKDEGSPHKEGRWWRSTRMLPVYSLWQIRVHMYSRQISIVHVHGSTHCRLPCKLYSFSYLSSK